MAASRFTFADMQNPLFLHPSDGPLTVSIPKLQGAADYRTWKRTFEIQLSAKRKLGFVNGTVLRSSDDETNGVQWDTCNNLVIAWIHNSVSDAIRKSILFIDIASEIWSQLEKRFMLTNGSRKYKLNKELFETRQGKLSISEYYTSLSIVWEEIEALNVLPTLTTVTPEIAQLLRSIEAQKSEAKLFLFLNGLNEVYASQRSQLLMITPLPTVESACAAIQQEELQREVLKSDGVEFEGSAMMSKGPVTKTTLECSVCNGKGHTADRCWTVIGYPKWHPKHKNKSANKNIQKNQGSATRSNGSKISSNNVQADVSSAGLTKQQLNQLLSLLPSTAGRSSDTDEEIDYNFSGMVTSHCLNAAVSDKWIVDSGATNHMTSSLELLQNVRKVVDNSVINLPTGEVAEISHTGTIVMRNGLKLKDVLYVPVFQHNLISIHKLASDNQCYAKFSPLKCEIVSNESHQVIAEGIISSGLYYMTDAVQGQSHMAKNSAADQFNLWHNRLGHTSATVMTKIDHIKQSVSSSTDKVCITCPLAKFTKLPYSLSSSHAKSPFELVHVDTWGPYKELTRGRYRYFLTLVDDFSRMTWIYLMEFKSDFLDKLKMFCAHVKVRFKADIQTLRTDNAPEFGDSKCTEFYAARGITHQTSCPYRPQQNSRVERKHRQILELSRALKFQSGLKPSF